MPKKSDSYLKLKEFSWPYVHTSNHAPSINVHLCLVILNDKKEKENTLYTVFT